MPRNGGIGKTVGRIETYGRRLHGATRFRELFDIVSMDARAGQQCCALLHSVPRLGRVISFDVGGPGARRDGRVSPFARGRIDEVIGKLRSDRCRKLILFVLRANYEASRTVKVE